MKKLLAMILAVAMALSGSVVAFAAEGDTSGSDVVTDQRTGYTYSKADVDALTRIFVDHFEELPEGTKAKLGDNATASDPESWDEGWYAELGGFPVESTVPKNFEVYWNDNTPKRIDEINCLSLGLTQVESSSGFGKLTDKLDVSGLDAMVKLDCANNQLSALDISGCTALKELYCSDNELTRLDLSECTALTTVYCNNNFIKTKDALILPEGFSGTLISDDFDDDTTGDNGDGGDNGTTDNGTTDNGTTNNGTTDNGTTDNGTNKPGANKPSTGGTTGTTTRPSTGTSTTTTTTESEKTETTRDDNYEAMKSVVNDLDAANSGKSTAKVKTYATAGGTNVSAVTVKLYGTSAYLSLESLTSLATGATSLNVSLDNGAVEILIPAGFTMPANSGMLAYPIGYQKDPIYSNLVATLVKGADAKSEILRVGGDLTLPTAATVTVKTKLTGAVNVYTWDEATRRVRFLTTATAGNGKVNFATKQLGGLLITSGTI